MILTSHAFTNRNAANPNNGNDNEEASPPIVRVAGLGWRSGEGAGEGEGDELVFEADSDWGDSDAEV